jgi:CubicO group peptidase (beta-lactamase class C family)
MKLSRFAVTVSLVLACYAICTAQAGPTSARREGQSLRLSQTTAKIDAYVQSQMRRYKIPGVSLAVLRKGQPAILKSYGLSNVELTVPVKPETIFQSGSIGKQFTAAAVMLLVQDGKISLDDKISKHLPDTPDSWKEITIRDLLTHTSGMGDYPDEISLRGTYSEDQYLDIFKKAPLNFAPQTSWDYSNVGYVTLGILISKLTGKFYGEFLRERLFGPMGMSTARVISEADIVPNRAAGYRLVNGELKNQEWVSPSTNSTADGSYYVSLLDMAKWDEGLTRDFSSEPSAQRVFTRSSLEQMWTPVKLKDGRVKGYGFGWFTDRIHNRRLVFHGGAWQGFKSFIIRFLDEELTIIFLANSWETNDFKLARGLISLVHPEFAFQPFEPILDRDPTITALFRRVMMQLKNGKADRALFTSELQASEAARIGALLNSLSLPVAVIHLAELTERRDEGGLRLYAYVLTDIGQTLVCTFKVTRDDKIARIELTSR